MPKKRKSNKRNVKERMFIVCEGAKGKSEYAYLNDFIKECNFGEKPVDVKLHDINKNTPKELVEKALKLMNIPQDKAWVVFDKDGYTKHNDAFQKAKNKVSIAFNSISFEFWVLLHFEYTTK